ncbi:MAG: hypothetical protein WAT53_09245 [Nitrosomonas sp.]|nr:hypothetical protein [Nitrosomonas sp.]MCC7136223.1 hypothetical protein [Nitrosomonas sp.]
MQANMATHPAKKLLDPVREKIRYKHYSFDFIHHHAHFVRLLAGFLNPTRLAKLDQHAFRSDGNQGLGRADKELAPLDGWARNFSDFCCADFKRLQDLFHKKPIR